MPCALRRTLDRLHCTYRKRLTCYKAQPAGGGPKPWLEINEEQGLEHINSLSEAYTGEPDYYKYNPGNRGKETRVVFKLSPTHVVSAG